MFDNKERQRQNPCRKKGDISKPSESVRGEHGVRQFHKCDESSIKPHFRRGLFNIPDV